ncbi:hypothetical protein HZC92_23450 [Klebsiella pneumoniae]|uniref:hypothetical protein n=1 Tax=Klebsiella pneumoniae TaxID=573 RepID=UPI001EFD56FC|nr:hypothetical protein [Klebsiella pneumoniae]MCG8978621.1 hypothetical protein [Klebsiella pneumoniae]
MQNVLLARILYGALSKKYFKIIFGKNTAFSKKESVCFKTNSGHLHQIGIPTLTHDPYHFHHKSRYL